MTEFKNDKLTGQDTRPLRRLTLLGMSTAAVLLVSGSALAGTTGIGSVDAVLNGFVEISATDASIAAFSSTPTSGDPGPRAFSTGDGFGFSNGFTNTRSLLDVDITTAENAAGSGTVTVQNTAHEVADWIYVLQGTNTHFTSYETTGVYDATAGDYTAPGGFTKDSQGTFTIRYYDKTTPADGGDGTTTVNWIYDAGANKYMFDATDKDFSNTNGEAVVWPSAKADEETNYAFTASGNTYGVPSVAGAGTNYVPTIRLAWQVDFSSLGSVTKNAYLLIDFPGGTPQDTYSLTMTATTTQLTS